VRTAVIGSWKLHQLRHIFEHVSVYASMGLFDEQVVESFHQVVKEQLRILAAVPKENLLHTLFSRVHNLKLSASNKALINP